MQILTEALILLIAGSFVGTLSGLLGIGGGLIIVPLLTYLLIHFHQVAFDQAMLMAIGTSLASIIFTGGVSSFFSYKTEQYELVNGSTLYPWSFFRFFGYGFYHSSFKYCIY